MSGNTMGGRATSLRSILIDARSVTQVA